MMMMIMMTMCYLSFVHGYWCFLHWSYVLNMLFLVSRHVIVRTYNFQFLSWVIDMQHFYKNQLQKYAQKRNLCLPVYSCEREGPPHASHFRCKVTVDGQTYESPEFFSTSKDAERAAAKVALTSLVPDGAKEASLLFPVAIYITSRILRN